MAIFVNNPTALEGYLALHAIYGEGSFTPKESSTDPAGGER
jgi:hypothetical protein